MINFVPFNPINNSLNPLSPFYVGDKIRDNELSPTLAPTKIITTPIIESGTKSVILNNPQYEYYDMSILVGFVGLIIGGYLFGKIIEEIFRKRGGAKK